MNTFDDRNFWGFRKVVCLKGIHVLNGQSHSIIKEMATFVGYKKSYRMKIKLKKTPGNIPIKHK